MVMKISQMKKRYKIRKKNKKAFYKHRNFNHIGLGSDPFISLSLNDLQEFFQEVLIENHIKLDDFVILDPKDLLHCLSNTAWTADKVKTTYHKLCLENGDKPISVGDLREMGHGGLAQAIPKYHGPKKQLDEDLGYIHMRNRSAYRNLDEVKEKLKSLLEENDNIPLTPVELKGMGHSTLVSVVSKLKSNFKKIYSELGYDFRPKLGVGHKKRIKFLKENGPAIIENYNRHGPTKTAELFGVSPSTIQQWIKDGGWEVNSRYKFDRKNKKEIITKLKKLGVIEAAKFYGVARITFYDWVRKLNASHLLPHNQNKKTAFLKNHSQEILKNVDKYGVKETARIYNFHYNTISRLARITHYENK